MIRKDIIGKAAQCRAWRTIELIERTSYRKIEATRWYREGGLSGG